MNPSTRPAQPSPGRTTRAAARSLASAGCILGFVVGVAAPPAAEARPQSGAKLLDYDDAQAFVLGLVNRDRKAAGLAPVVLDAPASRAGLEHARDMASHGFTGHLGSDGSTPEQRYTESGGSDFVQENAACLSDTVERRLDPARRFDASKLAQLETMFMAEKPPNDGHRRNILSPHHNRIGIGIAEPLGVPQPCLSQEFVDDYGDYARLPTSAKRGAVLHVAGTVFAPFVFGGVGRGRTPLPEPLPRDRLNGESYRIPGPDTLFFPPGFKTPKPVRVSGRHFSIDLALGEAPGSYAISVWAKAPNASQLTMISLRTVLVH